MFDEVGEKSRGIFEILIQVLFFSFIAGTVVKVLFPELVNTVFDYFLSFFKSNTVATISFFPKG